MKHLKSVTVLRAAEAQSKQDPAGIFFLQIWLTVMMMIIGKIFEDAQR